MKEPQIEILGAYRLPVTDDLLREQFAALYEDEMPEKDRLQAERNCLEQLQSTVLIEALVKNRDGRFDAGDFIQPSANTPKDEWQTAWAETYLTLDGSALMVEQWSDPPKTGDLRVAFFIHFWNPDESLNTSYGKVLCPQPIDMPDRLLELVPYEPVD